jgi:MscS family membrane protein
MEQFTSLFKPLEPFWELVMAIWNHGFMGVDIGRIIVAMGIIFIALILRGLFSRYVLYHLHKLTDKTETDIDDQIVDAVIPPVKLIPVVIGVFIAGQYLELNDKLADVFATFVQSLIVFTIFWGLHRAILPLSRGMKKLEKILTRPMMDWMFKFMRVLVLFIGGAVILELWGIAVAPLLAGLGLFGAAVALGAQDLFKNLIAGLTIIAEKRFHPGEWIHVDGVVEGTVEDIGFRSTRVRRFDKATVHVPNALLSDVAVTNFSRMTHRRIYWKIGVIYSSTTDQLKLIRNEIEHYIHNNEDFESPEKVSTFVRIDEFNASSIDILVYCFTKTTNWGEWLAIKEEFALKIKEIVEDNAKSGFAFPSTSLYVEALPNGKDQPETFSPPEKLPPKKTPKKRG